MPRVRRGDHRVGCGDQQHPHPVVGAEAVQQLVGGDPGPGQLVRVDPPDRGDVRPVGRVGELAVAGELVGLLPVLAPTLAVALTGHRAVPRARAAAGQAERQRQVDPGGGGVGAVGVLLGAAGGEDHRGARGGQLVHHRGQLGDREAGDPLHPVRPVGAHRAADRVEAGGAFRDVLLVDQAVPDRDVQQAVGQRQVGAAAPAAGAGARAARSRCDAGRPRCAGRPRSRPRWKNRMAGGMVSAGLLPTSSTTSASAMSANGNGMPAVDAERPGRCGGRRGHAEPAVVVDVRRAQPDPGELAQLVGLLVGQPAAAEAAHRVRPVRAWVARDGRRRPGPAPRPSSPGAAARRGSPGPAGWSAAPGAGAARRRWPPSCRARRR